MADPLEAFSEAFNQSMGRERELSNKMKMLKYQSTLEAQQPTPEMRLFDLFKTDPETFKSYMRAKDPLDAFYKQGMLNYYMGNLALEKKKFENPVTGHISDVEYITKFKNPKTGANYTPDEAMGMIFKPDPFQMMIQSIFGGQSQNNTPQPQNQNGLFTK